MYMYICNKLVLIFWGEKLVGANFYAFCNYAPSTQFCNAQNLLNIKALYDNAIERSISQALGSAGE